VAITVFDTRRDNQSVDQLTLHLVTDHRAAATHPTYRAAWQVATSGPLLLRVTEPVLEDLNLERSLDVVALDDELRQVRPDHQRLKTLAQQTGGRVVPLDDLATIWQIAPNRAKITPNDVRETLWDSAMALCLVIFLLTLEWIIRRAIRLV